MAKTEQKYGAGKWYTISELHALWCTVHGDVPFPTGPDNTFDSLANSIREQLAHMNPTERIGQIAQDVIAQRIEAGIKYAPHTIEDAEYEIQRALIKVLTACNGSVLLKQKVQNLFS